MARSRMSDSPKTTGDRSLLNSHAGVCFDEVLTTALSTKLDSSRQQSFVASEFGDASKIRKVGQLPL